MKTMTTGQRVTARIAAADRRDAKAEKWQLAGPPTKTLQAPPVVRVCGDCNGTGHNVADGRPCFCELGDQFL